MKETVHILGCGPAGLVAAHAAVELGHDIRIFSKNRKSTMYGAQYLHEPIPALYRWPQQQPAPINIRYTLTGSISQYRWKVYGPAYDGSVSPGSLESNHMAWDIRSAYNMLWETYHEAIENVDNINPLWLGAHQLQPMISSIPLQAICLHNELCNFKSAYIWAAGDAPELGLHVSPGIVLAEGEVRCNGLANPAWYRASRIFGRTTIEWPWATGPNAMAPAAVTKPISNNCQCWPDVLRVGRYGKWEKGVLVHHAFEEAWKWLSSGRSQS